MISQPLVSVVTPAYNEDNYIRDCIESVQAQTYKNWHYVIVDNCSNDRTLEIAEEYAVKDSRIRICRNENFVNAIANHNIAFQQVSPKSKYCKLVAADDTIFPGCIEQMVALAEEYPSVAVVGSYRIAGEGVRIGGLPFPDRRWSGRDVCRAFLLGGNYPFGVPTSTLYRSDVVRERLQFFDEERPHADVKACFDVLQDHDFGFVHQILCQERIRDNSLNAGIIRSKLQIYQQLDLLVSYGRIFLSNDERDIAIRSKLAAYYDCLASCCYTRMGNEFWQIHRKHLAKLGYPLNSVRLTICAGSYGINAALSRIRRRLYGAPV